VTPTQTHREQQTPGHIPVIGRLKLWELVTILLSALIAFGGAAGVYALVASLPGPSTPGIRPSAEEVSNFLGAIIFTYPAILVTSIVTVGGMVAFVVLLTFAICRLRKAAREAREPDAT
jgi:hypothetical protein